MRPGGWHFQSVTFQRSVSVELLRAALSLLKVPGTVRELLLLLLPLPGVEQAVQPIT